MYPAAPAFSARTIRTNLSDRAERGGDDDREDDTQVADGHQ
jgi:hypothetical protein